MANVITKFIFDKIGVADNKKYLDLAALKHKLVAGNIANLSTPGFKSRHIDFQKEFLKATDKSSRLAGTMTNSSHIPTGNHRNRAPKIKADAVQGNDLNSVNIDREVSDLAQNELLFTVGAKLMADRFMGIRKAIKGEG